MAKKKVAIKGTGFLYAKMADCRDDVTKDILTGMSVRESWEKYRSLIACTPTLESWKVQVYSRWKLKAIRREMKIDLQDHAKQLAAAALDKQKRAIENHYSFMDQVLDNSRKVVIKQRITKENVDGILSTTASIDVLARKLYGLDDIAPISASQRNVALVMNADQIINQVAMSPQPLLRQ